MSAPTDASLKRPLAAESSSEPPSNKPRVDSSDDADEARKRAVYLLVAYLGTGYCGLQYQPGQPTIENAVFRAVCAAGLVSSQNAESLSKIKWNRAARTDKGVHAAVNLITFKCLMLKPEDVGDNAAYAQYLNELVAKVNEHMPPEIRALSIQRCMGGFHAKNGATSRSYDYIIPTYALDGKFATISESMMERRYECLMRRQRKRNEDYKRLILDSKEEEDQDGKAMDHAAIMKQARKKQRNAAAANNKGKETSDGEGEDDASDGENNDNDLPGYDSDSDYDEEYYKHFSSTLTDDIKHELCQYRIDPVKLQSLDGILQEFVGSHIYFAFTRWRGSQEREDRLITRENRKLLREQIQAQMALNPDATPDSLWRDEYYPHHDPTGVKMRRRFNEATYRRQIHWFRVSETFIDTESGIEMVRFTVHGQSFMLNQIRKMIATVVLIARGLVDKSQIFPAVFQGPGIHLPIAPASGLYLDRPFFAGYDKKCQQLNAREKNPLEHRVSVSAALEPVESVIHQFKRDFIWKQICKAEREGFATYRWLDTLSLSESMIKMAKEKLAKEKAATGIEKDQAEANAAQTTAN